MWIMKLGIVFKEENARAKKVASEAKKFLQAKNVEVASALNLKEADFILVFGGDGTLIHKACEFVHLQVPIVGINTGNLGFLTAVEVDDWKKALDSLVKKQFFVSERISVAAGVSGRREQYLAINEVFIKGLFRAIDLEVNLNSEKFMSVLGDGIIVATQTGSTAYSLSAGGPIVDPDLDCLLLTPINSIGLPIPSLVLSPNDKIEVKIVRGVDVSLVLDGQEHTKVKQGDRIEIKRGKYKVKLVYFDKHHFVKSLNAKFGLADRIRG